MSGESPASYQKPQQLALFEFVQEKRADGSLVVTPTRVVLDDSNDRDVDTKWAAKKLGLSQKQVCLLCKTKELKNWQLPSVHGNAKYRISRNSVLTYKPMRQAIGGM